MKNKIILIPLQVAQNWPTSKGRNDCQFKGYKLQAGRSVLTSASTLVVLVSL